MQQWCKNKGFAPLRCRFSAKTQVFASHCWCITLLVPKTKVFASYCWFQEIYVYMETHTYILGFGITLLVQNTCSPQMGQQKGCFSADSAKLEINGAMLLIGLMVLYIHINLFWGTPMVHILGAKPPFLAPDIVQIVVEKLKFLHQWCKNMVQIAPVFSPLFGERIHLQSVLQCASYLYRSRSAPPICTGDTLGKILGLGVPESS